MLFLMFFLRGGWVIDKEEIELCDYANEMWTKVNFLRGGESSGGPAQP